MNPLTPYLAFIKAGVIVLIVGSIFGAGWLVNGWRWETKYAKLDAAMQQFKTSVAVLGEKAKEENAIRARIAIAEKEVLDEENQRIHARDSADIRRLRDERDRARGSAVPPAPAGSSRPDLLCLDRAEFIGAYGEALGRLRTGARSIADEGTAATVDLDTGKRWVLRLKSSQTLTPPK